MMAEEEEEDYPLAANNIIDNPDPLLLLSAPRPNPFYQQQQQVPVQVVPKHIQILQEAGEKGN